MGRRSPLFVWMVVVVVAVLFVMVAGQVIARTPTGGNYSVAGAPENASQQLIVGSITQAPNYMIPGIFVMMAIFLIGALFLVKKRTG